MKNYEQNFIDSFIKKNRRDRLSHELGDPKKRYQGIGRFDHQADDLLDQNKIIMKDSGLELDPEFIRFVSKHNEPCYIVSSVPDLDGHLLKLDEAIDKALVSFDAFLILGDDFAIIFSEVMKGGRDKYLLMDKKVAG